MIPLSLVYNYTTPSIDTLKIDLDNETMESISYPNIQSARSLIFNNDAKLTNVSFTNASNTTQFLLLDSNNQLRSIDFANSFRIDDYLKNLKDGALMSLDSSPLTIITKSFRFTSNNQRSDVDFGNLITLGWTPYFSKN